MAWRFWSRASEPGPVGPDAQVSGPDDSVPDLDLAEMLGKPPPSPGGHSPLASVYVDQAAATPRPVSEWTKVDVRAMRKAREHREAQSTLWARVRRGEVSTGDIPGQDGLSRLVLGVAESSLAPLMAIAQNRGVVLLVIATAVGFGVAGIGLSEFVNHHFVRLGR